MSACHYPVLPEQECRAIVTATAIGFSNRVDPPIGCLHHVSTGQAGPYPGGQSTSKLSGASPTPLSKDDTGTACRFQSVKAQVSTFTTRVPVKAEGRTARPAGNDRFTFQFKTSTRKGGLMESGRCALRQRAGFQSAPVISCRQFSGTVRLLLIQGAFPFFQ